MRLGAAGCALFLLCFWIDAGLWLRAWLLMPCGSQEQRQPPNDSTPPPLVLLLVATHEMDLGRLRTMMLTLRTTSSRLYGAPPPRGGDLSR